MSGEEVLIQSELLYKLARAPGGALFIEVVVGGIVQSAVRVFLDEKETESYRREGRTAANRLARSIMANPPFGGRATDI